MTGTAGVSSSNLFRATFGNPLASGIPAVRGQVPFGQPLFNLNPNASALGGFNGGSTLGGCVAAGTQFQNGSIVFQPPFVAVPTDVAPAAAPAGQPQVGRSQLQSLTSFLPLGSNAQLRMVGNNVVLNGAVPINSGVNAALQQQQLIDAMMRMQPGVGDVPNEIRLGTGAAPLTPQR